MSQSKITAAALKVEFERLSQSNHAWQLYMAALLQRFTELEAVLLNSPSISSDEMRSKLGTLAGFRTALTLPHTMVLDLEGQEIQQQETEDGE